MLDTNKIAETKNSAPVGGPPGTKVNKTVQKQLIKLIAGAEATAPTDGPTQAVAVKEGAPTKPSTKKALKWAIKKFGEEGVKKMAKGTGMKPKAWAVEKYTEMRAAKAKAPDPNVERPQTVEQTKAWAKQDRDQAIDKAILSLKVSTSKTFEDALRGFIDGPCKEVLDSFVKLFASRNTDGEGDEAVLALHACKKAFDACGLLLVDVKTSAKKEKVSKAAKPITETRGITKAIERGQEKRERREAVAKASKKSERVRKPLTPEQREAKNKKDRERRAKAKKAS